MYVYFHGNIFRWTLVKKSLYRSRFQPWMLRLTSLNGNIAVVLPQSSAHSLQMVTLKRARICFFTLELTWGWEIFSRRFKNSPWHLCAVVVLFLYHLHAMYLFRTSACGCWFFIWIFKWLKLCGKVLALLATIYAVQSCAHVFWCVVNRAAMTLHCSAIFFIVYTIQRVRILLLLISLTCNTYVIIVTVTVSWGLNGLRRRMNERSINKVKFNCCWFTTR